MHVISKKHTLDRDPYINVKSINVNNSRQTYFRSQDTVILVLQIKIVRNQLLHQLVINNMIVQQIVWSIWHKLLYWERNMTTFFMKQLILPNKRVAFLLEHAYFLYISVSTERLLHQLLWETTKEHKRQFYQKNVKKFWLKRYLCSLFSLLT